MYIFFSDLFLLKRYLLNEHLKPEGLITKPPFISKTNVKCSYSQLKCALGIHLICTGEKSNWALNMVLFYALVLMFLTKFVPKSTIRRCSSGIMFWNYDFKFAQNIMQIFLSKYHFLTIPEK